MESKVNFGHPIWPTAAILSKISKKIKVTYRSEMRSKVNFGLSKWLTAAIMSTKFQKNKVAYRSEMARNAIKGEFRTSKICAGGHFVKTIQIKKFRIYLKRPEMPSKVNF